MGTQRQGAREIGEQAGRKVARRKIPWTKETSPIICSGTRLMCCLEENILWSPLPPPGGGRAGSLYAPPPGRNTPLPDPRQNPPPPLPPPPPSFDR